MATSGADDVRARAEAAADAGSTAAALALMTAAADDAESADPSEAALLVADAAWYARLAHGPERALQLAHRAVRLARDADDHVALVVHARLGDALQWNGRRARECAYLAAARAEAAGDHAALRDALTFQSLSELHLGLLREARASATTLESAAGAATTGDGARTRLFYRETLRRRSGRVRRGSSFRRPGLRSLQWARRCGSGALATSFAPPAHDFRVRRPVLS